MTTKQISALIQNQRYSDIQSGDVIDFIHL